MSYSIFDAIQSAVDLDLPDDVFGELLQAQVGQLVRLWD